MFYTFCDKMGHRVFHRYIDDDGKRHQEVVSDFPLELFMQSPKGADKGFGGERLGKLEFTTVKDALDFAKEYKDVAPIHGQTSIAHQFISKTYTGEIEADPSRFTVLNFDIEVEHSQGFPEPSKALYEVLSVSMKVFGKDQKITLGMKPYTPKRKQDMYIQCANEFELLTHFVNLWKRINPDMITGWYIESFDIPYMINRIKKVLGESFVKQLSPFCDDARNVITSYELNDDTSYRILGITTMDYIAMYQKFSPDKLESYRLNFVCENEEVAGKINIDQWGGDLMRLYHEDFETFIQYNEEDVGSVERLDEKLQFIRLAVRIGTLTKSRYQEVFGTVKIWDNLIYNMLLADGVQIPPEKFNRDAGSFAGGFVKEPRPGCYDWVSSVDLESLYPGLIRMYNMSPETLVDEAQGAEGWMNRMLRREIDTDVSKSQGLAMAANGSTYDKTRQGVIPRAMQMLFDERKAVKQKMLGVKKDKEAAEKAGKDTSAFSDQVAMLDAMQKALKVVANGGYGAIGNGSFRYYRPSIAEGITLSGQLTIKFITGHINDFLNKRLKTSDADYVIAADTDSAYLDLGELVKQELEKETIEETVNAIDDWMKGVFEPFLAARFVELSDYMGAMKNHMYMKRETICDKGIFRGKKNYLLQVWDNEGVRYTKPVIKVAGLESQRSSTPGVCREELKACFEIILNGTQQQLIDRVKDFRFNYSKLPLNKIASPRGVSDMDKWMDGSKALYKGGTPIHVKAAIHYNDFLNKNPEFARKYPAIKNGNKMKFIYLKQPNPLHNTAIGFPDELPSDFGLDEYLDVDTQFDKTFLSALKSIASLAGMETEKRSTLKGLFR